DRAARVRIRRRPMDRETRLSARLRMRGDADVIGTVEVHKEPAEKTAVPPRPEGRPVPYAVAKVVACIHPAHRCKRPRRKYSDVAAVAPPRAPKESLFAVVYMGRHERMELLCFGRFPAICSGVDLAEERAQRLWNAFLGGSR